MPDAASSRVWRGATRQKERWKRAWRPAWGAARLLVRHLALCVGAISLSCVPVWCGMPPDGACVSRRQAAKHQQSRGQPGASLRRPRLVESVQAACARALAASGRGPSCLGLLGLALQALGCDTSPGRATGPLRAHSEAAVRLCGPADVAD